jgi:hypothetical protein
MEKNTNDHIAIKMFLGCLITPEIRMHLHNSPSWKQSSIAISSTHLKEIHFQEKDYFGHFLAQSQISLNALKESQKELLTHLQQHCPDLCTDSVKMVVFPQVFLS